MLGKKKKRKLLKKRGDVLAASVVAVATVAAVRLLQGCCYCSTLYCVREEEEKAAKEKRFGKEKNNTPLPLCAFEFGGPPRRNRGSPIKTEPEAGSKRGYGVLSAYESEGQRIAYEEVSVSNSHSEAFRGLEMRVPLDVYSKGAVSHGKNVLKSAAYRWGAVSNISNILEKEFVVGDVIKLGDTPGKKVAGATLTAAGVYCVAGFCESESASTKKFSSKKHTVIIVLVPVKLEAANKVGEGDVICCGAEASQYPAPLVCISRVLTKRYRCCCQMKKCATRCPRSNLKNSFHLAEKAGPRCIAFSTFCATPHCHIHVIVPLHGSNVHMLMGAVQVSLLDGVAHMVETRLSASRPFSLKGWQVTK